MTKHYTFRCEKLDASINLNSAVGFKKEIEYECAKESA